MAVALDTRDVVLRDGTTLRLRPPLAADSDAVTAFLERLSPRSRYLRFHGGGTNLGQVAATVVDPDWAERGALVGTLLDEGEERVVALGTYVRLRDRRAAESSFVVADEHQGRGIGTRLLEALAEVAGANGVEGFLAEVLPDNAQMLRVFERAGFRAERKLESGVIEVRFPIEATETYRMRVAERDHAAVAASLEPFFRPRTVAVVGASPRRGSIGGELFRNVLGGDFTGAVHPVNRGATPVAGVRAYESVAAIGEPVDLAVICVPGALVPEAAEEALDARVRALCVISAGFAETGPEGAARQDALLARVRAHGVRMVGPNCLGIASAEVRLNATFAPRAFPPGRIGFSSQSGALGLALLERAEARGLGLSAFVSIGNKADVSSNDLLEWWTDDDNTDLVLLYVESFGNPRTFARVARRLAREKPVLAMKSGTTGAGQRAAGSHTAALAGSDTAVATLFRQAGVVRAETLEELLDVASLLSSQPAPKGRRVAILTNAGGLGILCADACEAAGLELPSLAPETVERLRSFLPAEASAANPVDMLGGATADSYRLALPALLGDPGVDAVIVLFVPPVVATPHEVGAAISEAVADARAGKPVLACVLAAEGAPASLRSAAGVPAFDFPESAARALGRASERAEWLRRPAGTVAELEGVDEETGRRIVTGALAAGGDGWLAPEETRALLDAYGVPLVPERVADGPGDAVAAAREVGFPAVVKTATPGAHKTETGGVALDLRDEDAVRAAAARIGGPVVVQPMIRGGAELLAGVVQDAVFGPLVAFGPGGVFAELIGQAQFRLAPLTDVDAAELVRAGKVGRLVAGFRGAPPADTEALEDLLQRLGRLGEDLPEVAELDLNPVVALPDGAVAVDARVRVAPPAVRAGPKSW
jgi:acetyl coenzyme A synthetase (ADP forming)-like protein